MPRRIETIEGRLVAIAVNEYPTFTTQAGDVVPAGTTYTAWVVEDDTAEPTSVRIPADVAVEMRQYSELPFPVEITATLFAAGRGQLVHRYVGWAAS